MSQAASSELVTAGRALRRAELWVSKRMQGIGPGAYRSQHLGEGVEFADIREYSPGDDVRSIDWNVTARTGHPHVRVYEADRETSAFLIMDRSASMGFGTAGQTKEQLLRELVAAVSVLVLRRGNRLGGLLFSDERLAGLPFSSGRKAALRLLQLLDDVRPEPGAGSRLDLALDETAKVVRRRSIIVVISDWLDAGTWQSSLARLALHHEVLAIEVADPREDELPAVGPLVVEDPETGRQFEVDTSRSDIRERFAAAAGERRRALSASIAGVGAAHLAVSTGRDWLEDLLKFLDRQKRRGRRTA